MKRIHTLLLFLIFVLINSTFVSAGQAITSFVIKEVASDSDKVVNATAVDGNAVLVADNIDVSTAIVEDVEQKQSVFTFVFSKISSFFSWIFG